MASGYALAAVVRAARFGAGDASRRALEERANARTSAAGVDRALSRHDGASTGGNSRGEAGGDADRGTGGGGRGGGGARCGGQLETRSPEYLVLMYSVLRTETSFPHHSPNDQ